MFKFLFEYKSLISKVIIGIFLLKFIMIWVFIPAIMGFNLRNAEQCPDVDFEKLIFEELDKKINEIIIENPGIVSYFVKYKQWSIHQQFKIFRFVFEATSGCEI